MKNNRPIIVSITLITLFVFQTAVLFAQENQEAGTETSPVADQDGRGVTVRIRDIARFEGVRENQLLGFGLVTGLRGAGDSSRSDLVKKMVANLIRSFQVDLEPDSIQSKNSAAVVVTATVPPFVRVGQKIDVEVASLLDARDLEGGILIQTNLKGANGEVYAVAQGRVIGIKGEDTRKTVGRILDGGIVEKQVLSSFQDQGAVSVLLEKPDFTMAVKIRDAIKDAFPHYNIRALDAEKIEVYPGGDSPLEAVELSARIGNLTVRPDFPAKVVINRASGLVVMGQNVRVAPVVIAFKESELSVGWNSDPDTEEKSYVQFENTASVKDVVNVLKEAGLKIDDIIEILQTLQRAGALYGSVEVM